jgi:hypothetical protein
MQGGDTMLKNLMRFGLGGVFAVGISAAAPTVLADDNPVTDTASEAADKTKSGAETAGDATESAADKASETADEGAKKATDKSKDAAKKGADKTKEGAKGAGDKAQQMVDPEK